MDKQLLRPREVCVEPGAPDAGCIFAFWLRTLEDFIDSLRELHRDGDPELNLIYSKRSNPNCNGDRRDKMVLRTTCIKNVNFKIIKTRSGCQYV